MIPTFNFGQRLRQIRKVRGVTQAQLTDHIKVTPTTILNDEKNQKLGQIERLIKLCHVLGVTPNILLGFEQGDEK